MTLHFPMAALDKFNQVTFAEISLMLLTFNPTRTGTLHFLNKNWYLDSPMQMVSQYNCTLVNITFLKHSADDHDYFVLPLLVKLLHDQPSY